MTEAKQRESVTIRREADEKRCSAVQRRVGRKALGGQSI